MKEKVCNENGRIHVIMSVSKENVEIRDSILDFDRRIDEMHLAFQKYSQGEEYRVPNWEKLEMEILTFSRNKIYDLALSNNLDRVLFKFQNRIKRFNGVPPYDETVRYRNKVLEYYGDYLRKAKGNR